MDLDKYNIKEVLFLLNNYVKVEVKAEELTDVKILFLKGYSEKLLAKLIRICEKKQFFWLRFYGNDDWDDHFWDDDYEGGIPRYDTLEMYSFRINNQKHYLLFSTVWDIWDEKITGLKKETVELFVST